MVLCACQTVLMILKWGGNNLRGIGLVEVLWKSIYGIINLQISHSIQLYDALHGFCAGRGMGTATLEENLLKQIIAMRETFLHSIFLDILNACDALDRDQCLDILVGCVVGPRTLRVLWTYWVRLHMVVKAGGH